MIKSVLGLSSLTMACAASTGGRMFNPSLRGSEGLVKKSGERRLKIPIRRPLISFITEDWKRVFPDASSRRLEDRNGKLAFFEIFNRNSFPRVKSSSPI